MIRTSALVQLDKRASSDGLRTRSESATREQQGDTRAAAKEQRDPDACPVCNDEKSHRRRSGKSAMQASLRATGRAVRQRRFTALAKDNDGPPVRGNVRITDWVNTAGGRRSKPGFLAP